jgi:hypothetical protein
VITVINQYRTTSGGKAATWFVMVPLIEAINMMLFPKRTICLPAACAVNSTPFVLMCIT